MTTPPVAHARRTDPETSHEAADSVDRMPRRLTDVLTVLREFGPMHDVNLCAMYRQRARTAVWNDRVIEQTDQSIRSRRAELTKRGLIEWTGDREVLPSGRRARVWRAVGS